MSWKQWIANQVADEEAAEHWELIPIVEAEGYQPGYELPEIPDWEGDVDLTRSDLIVGSAFGPQV